MSVSNIIEQVGETQAAAPKPRGGAPRGNRNAVTHGHYGRKIKLTAVGFSHINKSTAGGFQLSERNRELVEHCGGKVTAVTRRVIERICFSEYLLDHLDLHLAELGPNIINRRKRTLIPIVLQRDALVTTLTRLYDTIGYAPRKPRTAEAIAEGLADQASGYGGEPRPNDNGRYSQ